MLNFNRQETTRSRHQKLAELRHQLRFAVNDQERRAILTQLDFWRQQP